ncbi:MAG: hypothetical protein C0472_09460 [Erythrobacter sp.]|nr:hypothetical protein [Erythrobacter sp.]
MNRKAGPESDPAPDPLAFTPVPRQRMRRRGWSAARQRDFIAHLAETGSVRAACRRMGVGEHQVYVLRNHPEGASFAAAWEAALDMGIQRIEDTAMDRALNGVEAPVFYHGEKVGERMVYNDHLLMFMLRNRAPERFAAGGGPKGLNAVSQMQLDKLKKQWRAEWEAERPNVSTAEVRASIDRKIDDIRRRIERERPQRRAVLSEDTLAAFAHFAKLRDRDLDAAGADERTRKLVGGDLGTPTDFYDPPATPRLPAPDREAEEPSRHPPEGYSYGKPKPAPPPKTVWSLKDESFDP